MGYKMREKCIFCHATDHKYTKCSHKPSAQCEHDLEGHKKKHCSLVLLEKFMILQHDVVQKNLHKPKRCIAEFQHQLLKALQWFRKHGEQSQNACLHLQMFADLHERVYHLFDVIKEDRHLKKYLKAVKVNSDLKSLRVDSYFDSESEEVLMQESDAVSECANQSDFAEGSFNSSDLNVNYPWIISSGWSHRLMEQEEATKEEESLSDLFLDDEES